MIILISGPIGAGKDTFCELFQKHSSIKWENKKFAGKLKQIVALLTGCKVEDLEKEEFKNQYLPEEFDIVTLTNIAPEGQEKTIYKYTYRELLQKLGTELLRDGFHPQVHLNAFYADYKPYKNKTWEDDNPNQEASWFNAPYQGKCSECKQLFFGYKNQSYCNVCAKKNRYPHWLVTDTRFKNEFESAKKYNGITIRIERSMACSQWIESKYFKDIEFTDFGFDFLILNEEELTKTDLLNLILHAEEKFIKNPTTDKNWLKLIHQSETDLNFYAENKQFDFVIHNNSTLEEFEEKIIELIKKIESGRH